MSSRAEVVQALLDTDLSTMLAAIEVNDPTLIRMANGDLPTDPQRQLIMSATVADWQAARCEMRSRTSTVGNLDDEDDNRHTLRVGQTDSYKPSQTVVDLDLDLDDEDDDW